MFLVVVGLAAVLAAFLPLVDLVSKVLSDDGMVSYAMRQRLEALGVRRVLDKPVAMGALIDAVEQALAGPRTPPPLPVTVTVPETLDPPAAPPCATAIWR